MNAMQFELHFFLRLRIMFCGGLCWGWARCSSDRAVSRSSASDHVCVCCGVTGSSRYWMFSPGCEPPTKAGASYFFFFLSCHLQLAICSVAEQQKSISRSTVTDTSAAAPSVELITRLRSTFSSRRVFSPKKSSFWAALSLRPRINYHRKRDFQGFTPSSIYSR